MRKIIEKGISGIGISTIITLAFMFKFAENYSNEELVIVMFWWMLFGAIAGISSMLFNKLENLLVATVVHFGLIFGFFSVVINITIPNLEIGVFIGVFIQFLLIYIVIYFIGYITSKREAEKINNSIK